MRSFARDAWRYRNFILSSILADVRQRFARSRIGGAWVIIHPLAQVALFALILSKILSAKLPGIDSQFAYAIYLSAGILAWSLFAELLNSGATLFISNGELLKKIAFPRICLPIIMAGTALVNHVSLLLAILIIFTLLGHLPTRLLLWMPLLIVLMTGLGLGLGLVLGVLNVFMRDVGQVLQLLLQFGFWLTPIVYMPEILPDSVRPWLLLNPVQPLVRSYQDVLSFQQPPALGALLASALLAGLMLVLALWLFRRAEAELVDQL
ncbi:ABC transporter permease [Lamprobacter sp.]|uniref:ABC transporter permease n=1 Tax=Lamprobacter sp. TaxID=3100796 RepID=UPI002B256DA5|nr:ABC transporter permease [Lamprobacter sp.]